MKIGIMGGTFNPIHQGHLIQAETVREAKNLDKIIFLPSGRPPHKDKIDVLDSRARKAMVELAITSNPYFQISDLEVHRPGPSYTIDSLARLEKLYARDKIYLIMGRDSLLDIHQWKDYEKILARANILVMDRYDSGDRDLDQAIDSYNRLYGRRIERVPTPIIQISSTDIRKRVGQGQSIKYLVPETVDQYIRENQLYTRRQP